MNNSHLNNLIQQMSEVWIAAAKALSFRIEAPYLIQGSDGQDILCVAYLPDFGGPKGIIIGVTHGPLFKSDGNLKLAAKALGVSYSFINFDAYKTFDEEAFKEALADWGFYGNHVLKPSWL